MIYSIAFATFGVFFGYLNGMFLIQSASLIRLALCIVLLCTVFFFFSKRDPVLRSSVIAIFCFSFFFIYGSIVGHMREATFEVVTRDIDAMYVVRDVGVKDSTKTILLDDLVVYTKSNLPLAPEMLVHIRGTAQNESIIMPSNHDTDFSSFDLARYWQTRGIEFVSYYPDITLASSSVSSTTSRHSLGYYAYSLRQWFLDNLQSAMPDREAGIMMAMLWGDDNTISRDTASLYRDAGVSHILVLSGYNLAILAGAVALLFRNKSVKTRVIISVLSIALFLLVVKSGVPLYRAALMALYALLATLFMRPANSKFIIWVIAFLFIIVSPVTAVYDVSFHLSLLATMGIIYFYPELKDFAMKYSFWRRFKKNIVFDALLVSFSATVLTFPYIVYTFGLVNTMSVPVNMLVSLFVPVIMLFGFLTSFFGWLPFLGKLFGALGYVFVSIVTWLTELVAHNAYISHPISFVTLIIIYLIIFICYRVLRFTLLYPNRPITK